MKKFLAKLYLKLIIFFAIAFVVFLLARILFGYFVSDVPAFEPLLTPLLWLCIAAAILTVLFIVMIIIKARRKDKDDSDYED